MSARMIKLRSTVVSMSLIVIIAMVAVGCGNNTANGNNINKSKTEAASQVKESTPVAEVGTPATEEATTRTVTDAYGETTIPVYPERIVVLNTAALDNLLALGVKP